MHLSPLRWLMSAQPGDFRGSVFPVHFPCLRHWIAMAGSQRTQSHFVLTDYPYGPMFFEMDISIRGGSAQI